MPTPEEQAVLDAAKEAEAQAAKAQGDKGQVPKTPTQADIDEQIAQRRKANHEAQAAKKRADDLEAKFKAQEDAKKDETTRAIEEAAALKAQLAEERTARAHAQDMVHVVSSGVQEPYAEFVAGQLARARAADPDLDIKTFMAEQQKQSPAFFNQPGNGKKPGAAGGGQIPGDSRTQLTQEVSALETQIAAEQKLGNTRKVFGLMQQRAAKLEELGAG
jgi:hypothetical protein